MADVRDSRRRVGDKEADRTPPNNETKSSTTVGDAQASWTGPPRVAPIGRSDKPSLTDFLDREIFVSAIGALLMNEKTQAPLTIGIYGPWGSGKSSFLAQLRKRLPKQQLVAEFNPWRLNGGEVWAGICA